jgi:hypothetical protein
MRRDVADVRKFVIHRWRMIEAPNSIPINLSRTWRALMGYQPPFANGAVAGYSFKLNDDARGIVIARPNRLQVDGAALAQVCSMIGAKHRVELVRLAKPDETPNIRVRERLPLPTDIDLVEEWPLPVDHAEPLVAEYISGTGIFVGNQRAPWFAADDVDDALTFEDLDDAENYVARHALRRQVVLRYLSAARAEQDQREMALFNA